ncbi:MAG: hypothetical protein JSV88_14390, partial [Candidatus Aminicenantes bacterium]
MSQFESKRMRRLVTIIKGGSLPFLLLVLPVLMVLTTVSLNHARGPYWLGSNLDPEYVYLLNAANLASLKGVGHIDHPGTPVQVLGAVTIKVVHFFNFSSQTDWHTDVLQRPEYYLKAIHIVMTVLNVLMLLTLGMFTYFLTKNLWLSLWLQLSPFFSITLLQFGLTRVSPEPLLFFSSSLMIVVLVFVWKAHSDNFTTPRENVIMILIFGLITGFGIACKVTFIPLVLIPLILFPKLKNKILYLFAAAISFVIFTLPIIRMYPRFFDWIYKLFTHSGQYGSGSFQLVTSHQFIRNIKKLLVQNPFFSITLVLALAFIIITLLVPKWRKTSCPNIHFKLLVGTAAAQAAGLLMVSKHSANHYLLPVLNLAGITLFLIFFSLKHLLDHHHVNSKIFIIIIVIFLVALAVLLNPPGQLKKKINHLANLKEKSLAVYQEMKNNYQDYTRIYFYRSSSQEYALKFGSDLSRSYHAETLEKLYKHVYFYDIWTKRFTGFDYNRTISFESIRSKYGDQIVFQGSRGTKIPGLELKKVSEKRFYEGIYLIASGGQGGSFRENRPPGPPAKAF